MAKRFIETTLWDDPWFRALPLRYKLFWIFVWTRADLSGVWKVDEGAATFFIGEKIDPAYALELFNEGKGRVAPINGGGKWFVIQFIEFQYKKLSPASPTHAKVLEILDLHKIKLPFEYSMPYPIRTVSKEPPAVAGFDGAAEFEKAWAKYPKKLGSKEALRHFKASVKNDADLKMFYVALDNYLAEVRLKEQRFIQNGSTWFNNWRDWVSYKREVSYMAYHQRFPEDKRVDTTGRIGSKPQAVGDMPLLQTILKFKEQLEAGNVAVGDVKNETAKENAQ